MTYEKAQAKMVMKSCNGGHSRVMIAIPPRVHMNANAGVLHRRASR
jgi:hypothetical protein